MDLYQLSVVVSYCLLSEGLFKGNVFLLKSMIKFMKKILNIHTTSPTNIYIFYYDKNAIMQINILKTHRVIINVL